MLRYTPPIAIIYRLAVGTMGCLCLLTVSGCQKEAEATGGTDQAYIRMPGEKVPEIPMLSGSLFPLTKGSMWSYSVQTVNRQSGEKPKISREDLRVTGTKTVGKNTGVAILIYQDGKPFREEILRLDGKELMLAAAGINNSKGGMDTMSITPGIPLVQFPVEDGATATWEGILLLSSRQVAAPGVSQSRVSGREIVKTPVGEFGAYKIETVITTTIDRQKIVLYTARWLAPGIGLVRQRIITGNQVVTKELQKFVIGKG